MSLNNKVSWKDGMFLLPQHFQQAERSLESSLLLRLNGESPLGWGVLSLQLDEVAIAQGRISVSRLQGIMPDGTTVDIPETDPAPPPRAFQLPANLRALDVFVTLPARRPRHTVVTAETGRADVRYVEQEIDVPDDCDPSRSERIEVAAKNFRIAVSGEPFDGLVALRIGRIHRNAEGLPAWVADHIAPSLRVSSSPVLARLGRELHGHITARARSLSEARRQRGVDQLDFQPNDILSFWFLHTLNNHALALRHLLDLPGTHPARLYEELFRLAGGLSTFAKQDIDPPPYDHEQLTECFHSVDRQIRELLGHMFVQRYEIIALSRRDPFWVGQIAEVELRERAEFVLAVRGELPASEIVSRVPNACKIADLDGIERLVRTHVGGVRISHIARPPSFVPVSTDACYFRVHTEGPDWEKIRSSGQLAAYVPTWLPGVRLELIAIREAGASGGKAT